MRISIILHPCQPLLLSVCEITAILVEVNWYLMVILLCHLYSIITLNIVSDCSPFAHLFAEVPVYGLINFDWIIYLSIILIEELLIHYRCKHISKCIIYKYFLLLIIVSFHESILFYKGAEIGDFH